MAHIAVTQKDSTSISESREWTSKLRRRHAINSWC
jgi:hypothetical protein